MPNRGCRQGVDDSTFTSQRQETRLPFRQNFGKLRHSGFPCFCKSTLIPKMKPNDFDSAIRPHKPSRGIGSLSPPSEPKTLRLGSIQFSATRTSILFKNVKHFQKAIIVSDETSVIVSILADLRFTSAGQRQTLYFFARSDHLAKAFRNKNKKQWGITDIPGELLYERQRTQTKFHY